MPKLTVFVDGEAVELDIHEEDDINTVACVLEEMKFGGYEAFPTAFVEGKEVEPYSKVDLQLTYRFGK